MQTLDPIDHLVKKRRLAQLRVKATSLRDGFGMMQYEPHAKQDAFHRAGNFLRRGVFAGNRFGKSHMGCAEDCAWLYGERVWYPKDDPARTAGIPRRPVKGLVITTDWDKVDEIWTSERGDQPGKLWQALPRDFAKSKKRNHSGAIDTVEYQNGSLLRFDTVKSFLANPQGSESSDWDFIHIDEPCPEAMWKAMSRGLVDRGGAAWFTLTALAEPWITDLFVPRDTKMSEVEFFERTNFWMTRGAMADNPHLSKEAIELFAADLTEDEKACRLYGIPLALAGLIYKEFHFDRHVLQQVPLGWKSYNEPPKNWPVILSIDPHPQTPHAVLAAAVSPFNQVFLFDEVFQQTSIGNLCEIIKQKPYFDQVQYTLCDPIAWINDPITEGNMEDEFMRHGVLVDKATKALVQGIHRMKDELLRENNIYFNPHLEETLWEIQRWCWDTKNAERKNKPVDKDDHMMECMYRIFLSDPKFVDLAAWANRDPIPEEEVVDGNLELEDFSMAL